MLPRMILRLGPLSKCKHLADNGVAQYVLKCTGVKLDGKSIWKIHMDFFFTNPFFLNLFKYI